MLIRREQRAAIFAFVVLIIRLDEAVVGKFIPSAIFQELIVGSEYMGLVPQQIDNFHSRTRLIEVIKFGSLPGLYHSVVHAQGERFYLKWIHTNAAEVSHLVRKL